MTRKMSDNCRQKHNQTIASKSVSFIPFGWFLGGIRDDEVPVLSNSA